MNSLKNNQFYTDMVLHRGAVSQLVGNHQSFHDVPNDWHVIITDIKGSTKAVAAGMHQMVNLIATGSIIAALNIGRATGISIPFFFGGDGATLLVPASILDFTIQALGEHRQNAMDNFNLDLRVGSVPVIQVYEANHDIRLAKACLGKNFAIPVALGNGLKYAEKIIKAKNPNYSNTSAGSKVLDLEGMECRWDRIKPPKNTNEVVCLLVEVGNPNMQASIFQKVLKVIEQIYGPQPQRNPISIPRLKLSTTPRRIIQEMQTKLGQFDWTYLIKNFLLTFFGSVYFRFYQEGREYLHKIVELADTLVIDGRINTVISGTVKQRQTLVKELEKMEKAEEIFFGIHTSAESIMSCYVRNRDDQHIHFVDGAQGGYTQAAVMLKRKLRAAKS